MASNRRELKCRPQTRQVRPPVWLLDHFNFHFRGTNCRDVCHVGQTAVVQFDEAVAFRGVEPLHSPHCHVSTSCKKSRTRLFVRQERGNSDSKTRRREAPAGLGISGRGAGTKSATELRKFDSRTAAVRFVVEELEKTKRRHARMIVEGAQFGYVDIVRMYAGRKV